jgi:hypothetical protein
VESVSGCGMRDMDGDYNFGGMLDSGDDGCVDLSTQQGGGSGSDNPAKIQDVLWYIIALVRRFLWGSFKSVGFYCTCDLTIRISLLYFPRGSGFLYDPPNR